MDGDTSLVEGVNGTPLVEEMNDTPSSKETIANNDYKEYEDEMDTSDEEVSSLLIYFLILNMFDNLKFVFFRISEIL